MHAGAVLPGVGPAAPPQRAFGCISHVRAALRGAARRSQHGRPPSPSLWTTQCSRSCCRRRRVVQPCASAASAGGSAAGVPPIGDKRSPETSRLAASVALVLGLGVANRILNKMALVPLRSHLFFLALLQTFAYVVLYSAIFTIRRRANLITPRMLEAPDRRAFLLIGAGEAAAQLLSLVCVARLPGVVLPLLQQTILLWQVSLGYLLQGQRFRPVQVGGILLVAGGVAKAALPSGAGQGGSILGQADPRYAALYCCAFLVLALVAVVKDGIFRDARKKLNGRALDLFVVNTYGSAAQALCVLLLLPLLCSLRGVPLPQLPAYLKEGARAFAGQLSGTQGAPLVPLAYILCNMSMNVAVLNLLRTAGPVVVTLSMSALVPLSIWAFTFPWPLLGPPARLTPSFLLGTAALLAGIAAYNWPSVAGGRRK